MLSVMEKMSSKEKERISMKYTPEIFLHRVRGLLNIDDLIGYYRSFFLRQDKL